MPPDSKPPTVRSLDRSNLRLSADTIAGIDATRAARPGNISRNTWITEAIEEKLARDAVGASFQQSGSRRAHG